MKPIIKKGNRLLLKEAVSLVKRNGGEIVVVRGKRKMRRGGLAKSAKGWSWHLQYRYRCRPKLYELIRELGDDAEAPEVRHAIVSKWGNIREWQDMNALRRTLLRLGVFYWRVEDNEKEAEHA